MLNEPDLRGRFVRIAPRSAAKEELLQVHSPGHIRKLESTQGKAFTHLGPDTQASAFSYDAALLAAGGLCRAIEPVHAGRSKAQGFCLYNNVAVGVRFAQNRLGLGRILVVDWDLHHGNGTQRCFKADPTVLFFSVHQAVGYPGCGDAEYAGIFEKILRPVTLEFGPELILVSAGFENHLNDPLGSMRVTERGFAGLTRSILTTADQCCGGKLVMTLEGGYDLEALRLSVKAVLRKLAGMQATDPAAIAAGVDDRVLAYLLWRVRRVHGRYWKSLEPASNEGADRPPTVPERLRETMARVMDYLRS